MALFGGKTTSIVSLSPPVLCLHVAMPTAEGLVFHDKDALLKLDDDAVVERIPGRRIANAN